jgi:hypothetical protein
MALFLPTLSRSAATAPPGHLWQSCAALRGLSLCRPSLRQTRKRILGPGRAWRAFSRRQSRGRPPRVASCIVASHSETYRAGKKDGYRNYDDVGITHSPLQRGFHVRKLAMKKPRSARGKSVSASEGAQRAYRQVRQLVHAHAGFRGVGRRFYQGTLRIPRVAQSAISQRGYYGGTVVMARANGTLISVETRKAVRLRSSQVASSPLRNLSITQEWRVLFPFFAVLALRKWSETHRSVS